ncbi:hypothetical protein CIK06_07710 [Plantactinospora sp. KBS50]|nr:hypothetical protein CIK06_07710 [Plantactinospora sp. KBS50]
MDLDVCPCCGYRTGDTTCPVCLWTDDGRGGTDPDVARGGPNGELSLTDARLNFQVYGISHPRFRNTGRPSRREESS